MTRLAVVAIFILAAIVFAADAAKDIFILWSLIQ